MNSHDLLMSNTGKNGTSLLVEFCVNLLRCVIPSSQIDRIDCSFNATYMLPLENRAFSVFTTALVHLPAAIRI